MTKFMQCTYVRENAATPRQSGLGTFIQARLGYVFGGLVVVAGLSYLLVMNQISTGGFDVKQLQEEIDTLTKENATLELRGAELRSLSVIEAAAVERQMIATESVHYVTAGGASVAVR